MRTAFIEKLTDLAKKRKDIYLLTADTGYTVFEQFKEMFPDRYLNIGISEANMIGVASGLALSGKVVFVYAIVPFVTMRCFEQIRIDLCYQKLPVKIIGVGGGLCYGQAGATHHAIEDIGVMCCLPNMTVICPGDPVETRCCVEDSMDLKGPCYIRINKKGDPLLHDDLFKWRGIGNGIILKKGSNPVIIATGNMLNTSVAVCEILSEKGLRPTVVSMHTIKPMDRELIKGLTRERTLLVSIEEHSTYGGLGMQIANVIVEENLPAKLIKFAIDDCFVNVVGDQEYLREKYGLGAYQISKKILGQINLDGSIIIGETLGKENYAKKASR